jgi:heterodisulfide reductase subunit A-like polyferredoxin
MKAILQYQEIKQASNSDRLTCTARYLTDMPMSDCSFQAIKTAFENIATVETIENIATVETIFVDGPTGCWGVEIKVRNRTEPLPLLLE